MCQITTVPMLVKFFSNNTCSAHSKEVHAENLWASTIQQEIFARSKFSRFSRPTTKM